MAIDVVAPATHRERVANGKEMAFHQSWLADYPDVRKFLVFSGRPITPRAANYTHYSDAGFDAAWTRLWQNQMPQRLAFAETEWNGLAGVAVDSAFS